MIPVSGYDVTAQLYESAISLVYRARREQDHQPVILKILKQDYPTPAELTRFKQEYEITQSLNLDGVVKAYGLQNYQNTRVMFLEDFGGESLKLWMNDQTFKLQEFLEIAIQIAEILGEIHKRNIIHKDINPSNIVFNPTTSQIKLIDFGISTVLPRENLTLKNLTVLEGTLAYISPEQTGRMNRAIDYRTDFYSLGATFYELLTRQLPFEATNVLELIHYHIAKQPVPPGEVSPEVPQPLSDIVMKLMAKTAEERYQSAWGIKADLAECLNQLQTNGEITEFPLARQDTSDKFQIPQKLYGRQQEIETLLAAFERVSRGNSEMMLVSGYSGVGKTSLVQEIYQPITQKRGYFISGKFDQLQRNIPYASLIKAFQKLIQQLLSESEDQLATWREKLLTAFGPNAQVMIEVIPEIERIVGEQPAVPELEPAESQNRFNQVFQNFIQVFTQPEHPLVIFLDDLQWADSASLKLIQLLITASDSQYLFLVGAYRDNEVSAAHPLMLTLDEIRKTSAIVNLISLSPLELTYINQLTADTLHCDKSRAMPLAELVLQKTQGNPFFMNEFLKSLYTERLLEFDFDCGGWQWDLEQIQAAQITDNVVELMTGKIQKLPAQTQQVLKLAACIGNLFDLKTLAIVHEKTPLETAAEVWEAVQSGLILPLGNDYKLLGVEEWIQQDSETRRLEKPETAQLPVADLPSRIFYKFLHDRVQQAAYSLIPGDRKQVVHLQVGRLLLKNAQGSRDEKIFDIVNQLNFGIPLITNPLERKELAQLNLIAGKKAKTSAAYEPALNYFKVGMGLLEASSWQEQYDLTLALYEEGAEAAYLSGKFEEMERFAAVVLQGARTLLDKVQVYGVKIQSYTTQNKQIDAVKTGLEVLRLLGIRLPEKPNKLQLLLRLLQTKFTLAGKQIEQLSNLPEMTNPYKLGAMRILFSVYPAALHAAPDLFPLILITPVKLSVQYGNTADAPQVYAMYGLALCGVGDLDSGYQFGQFASRLLAQFNAQKLKARVLLMVNGFIRHWKEHVRETLNSYLMGYSSGLENGDLEFPAYCLFFFCVNSYCIGKELTELEQKMATYSHTIRQLKHGETLNYNEIFRQSALNLMNRSVNPCCLVGEAYNEQSMSPIHTEVDNRSELYFVHFNKLILNYLFEEYSQAIQSAATAKQHLGSAGSTLLLCAFHFYDSLAHIAVFGNAPKSEQTRILAKVKANQKKMKKWAHHAPMNYLHKFYLVEAEQQRILGQDAKAMDYYDRAIALAKDHEYLNEEALAHELAAKFYLANGKLTIAQAFMVDAHYGYLRWGATAKVKDLETRYPQLLSGKAETTRAGTAQTGISTGSTTSGSSSSDALDLATVIRASQALSSQIRLDRLLKTVMKLVIENAGAQKGYLILASSGELRIEAAGEVDSDETTVLQSIPVDTSPDLPAAIVSYVTRTQANVVLGDAAREGIFTTDPYITQNQPKSILCSPIINQGHLMGLLYLENNLLTGAFTPDRIEVLSVLSSQAAISIENALLYQTLEQKVEQRTTQLAQANTEILALNDRLKAENLRMSAELDITRRLQQMILPKEQELSQIPGLEIASFMEPAAEVGGDYYDVLNHKGQVKIGIGDITGHGLESGVLMIMVQTAVRTLQAANETDPVKFLSVLNQIIYNNVQRMNSDKNLTLSLLDYQAGHIRLSGQHEEIIVVRAGGQIERIDTNDLGFPIGLEANIADFVNQTEVQLNPGDGIVLYTDGITEAENQLRIPYSLERLCKIVHQNWLQPASEIRQAIIDDVKWHIGKQKVYDDITLLVFKQK